MRLSLFIITFIYSHDCFYKNQISITLSKVLTEIFTTISFYNGEINNDFLVFIEPVLVLISLIALLIVLFGAPSIAPLIAFFYYFKKDFQYIIEPVLRTRVFFVFMEPFCKKLLKTRLPDLYKGKSHIRCYNFCQ